MEFSFPRGVSIWGKSHSRCLYCKITFSVLTLFSNQRLQERGVAPADCWNWGEWGLGTNERGPSLVGLLGLSCQYKRFLSFLGCFSWPSTKYFSHRTLFQSSDPIAQQAGQAVVLGRQSLSTVCVSVLNHRTREYWMNYRGLGFLAVVWLFDYDNRRLHMLKLPFHQSARELLSMYHVNCTPVFS
jgi:hypothetical protein